MYRGSPGLLNISHVASSQPRLPKYFGPRASLALDQPPSSQIATFVVFAMTDGDTRGLDAPAVPENVSIAAKNKAAAYFNDPRSSAWLARVGLFSHWLSSRFHRLGLDPCWSILYASGAKSKD